MPAPAYSDKSESTASESTSRTVAQPASTTVGQLLLCHVYIDSSEVNAQMTGWTKLGQAITATEKHNGAFFWKIATEAGAKNHSVTWGGAKRFNEATITTYDLPEGTDPEAPIADFAVQANTSSTSITYPSVEPSMGETLSVVTSTTNNVASISPPAGYTERFEATGPYGATKELTEAGATGTKTAALSKALPSVAAHIVIASAEVEPPPFEDFNGDFETGDTSQYLEVQAPEGRVTVVESPVGEGSYAGRFEYQEGDPKAAGGHRAEVIPDREFGTGETLFFRHLLYLPYASIDFNHYLILCQWHDTSEGSPPLTLQTFEEEGKKRLFIGSGDSKSVYYEFDIPGDSEWFELVYRIDFAKEGGSMEVWLNGESLGEVTGINTLGTEPTNWKLGIYRSSSAEGTTVVLHDGVAITDEFFSEPPKDLPSVTTEAASGVSTDAATLNGKVNPEGQATTYWFEYGKTEGLGSKTSEGSAGKGEAEVEKSKALSGLDPSTKYFFRLVAENATGKTEGEILNFTTEAVTPPVNTVAPAITGTAQVGKTLNCSTGTWEGEPESYAYQWQRSATGEGGWSDIGGATASSYKATAEDEGEFLRCVVTATNAGGETEAASAASAEVGPEPPAATNAARVLSEPLDDTLYVGLHHADGSLIRWAGDEPRASGIPQGIETSDGAPGGHRTASLSLLRDPRRDWPDLSLVDDIVIYGRTRPLNRSAFEGQMAHFPSELGDGESIGVNAVGHQALLSEDETWREIYAALGFDEWRDAPLSRRERNAELGRAQGKISVSTDVDGLVWDPPNEALPAGEVAEVHFQAPAGVKVAKFGYRGKRTGDWSNFEAATLWADDTEDFEEGAESTALTLDGTARTATLATAQRYVLLRALVSGAHTPAAGVQQTYDRLAVYGDHGLTLREIEGEPPGVYGHDAIAHMLDTGAPLLNYKVGGGGTIIPNTGFVVPDLAFPEPGTVADAILKLNAYFLNNFAVWDRKEFHWHPWDPERLTWRATIAGGAHWSPAGRQAETLLNGIVVSYTDAQGRSRLAGPPGSGCDVESELLLDTDLSNPYTRRGRRRWGILQVDFPLPYDSTAIQVGHVKMLEQRVPQRSGTLVVRPLGEGHVPQLVHPTIGPVPLWAPRSGDYVELDGWPEPEPFRIVEKPSYRHDSKTLTLQLDTASSRMSAIMERVGIGLKGVIR